MRGFAKGVVRRHGFVGIVALLGVITGCSDASGDAGGDFDGGELGATSSALVGEDGLAQAYGIFKQLFETQQREHEHYHIGFGFHPGLSTVKLLGPNGATVGGQAIVHRVTDFQGTAGTVTATLTGPASSGFDLYFVKNAVGQGTVKPENGDQIFKVGSFVADVAQPTRYTLSASIGTAAFPAFGTNFDLDMVVISQTGQNPKTNVIATGARTLFEKRYFRELAGAALDPVTGTLGNTVETTDPLVRRGSELFFNEKFAGNGRTCGTCHRLERNLTLDPAFVATLPSNDPLFIFPEGLEDRALLPHALIRENVDGFDDLGRKFVERSIPHTLAMSTSIGEVITALPGANDAFGSRIDGPPPEQRTGWSGDGSPGRGTMNEFAFGAVVQHFTLSTSRFVGSSFRVPTQLELDALEAFQLFSGRQKTPNSAAITYGDAAVNRGRDAALGSANCVTCHRDLVGSSSINFDIDTGVENLAIPFRTANNMPKDGGFGVVNFDANGQQAAGSVANGFGDAQFNVPPLYEAADTAPFFHNGAVATIEEAVNFYSTPEFLASRGARLFASPDQAAFPGQKNDIVAFLRTLNALTNITQVRKRVQFLAANATPGGTTIMNVAIVDTQDAITALGSPTLSGPATANALQALRTVKQSLQNSLPFANSKPTVPMNQVVTWLDIAKNTLITQNPLNDF
jgi:cytochrome c peroxidase